MTKIGNARAARFPSRLSPSVATIVGLNCLIAANSQDAPCSRPSVLTDWSQMRNAQPDWLDGLNLFHAPDLPSNASNVPSDSRSTTSMTSVQSRVNKQGIESGFI